MAPEAVTQSPVFQCPLVQHAKLANNTIQRGESSRGARESSRVTELVGRLRLEARAGDETVDRAEGQRVAGEIGVASAAHLRFAMGVAVARYAAGAGACGRIEQALAGFPFGSVGWFAEYLDDTHLDGITVAMVSMPSDMRAFNRSVVENFRANRGKITLDGMLEGADLVLLTTTGARSGRQHVVPLGYLMDGEDRVVLWASNMAAHSHPAWYRNLVANPQVLIERPTSEGIDRFTGTAHTASGSERERLFGLLGERYPHMAAHQRQTERQIPLVVVKRDR